MGAHRPAYIVIFVVASLVATGVFRFVQPRGRGGPLPDRHRDADPNHRRHGRARPGAAGRPSRRYGDVAHAVVGRYAAAPILADQYLDPRSLEATPGQRTFGFGARRPAPGRVRPAGRRRRGWPAAQGAGSASSRPQGVAGRAGREGGWMTPAKGGHWLAEVCLKGLSWSTLEERLANAAAPGAPPRARAKGRGCRRTRARRRR